jgi:hypothetical protein
MCIYIMTQTLEVIFLSSLEKIPNRDYFLKTKRYASTREYNYCHAALNMRQFSVANDNSVPRIIEQSLRIFYNKAKLYNLWLFYMF